MAIATDHGYAVITENKDGTVTVQVCSAIARGQPVDVCAMHVCRAPVWIDPRVRLAVTPTGRYTETAVSVSRYGRPVRIWPGPRLRSLPAPR